MIVIVYLSLGRIAMNCSFGDQLTNIKCIPLFDGNLLLLR
jgi:hypothetical protein